MMNYETKFHKNPLNRADAAASAAPPSEALGGLCRGSIVAAVESAIFRVQIDQLPGHSRTRFIFFRIDLAFLNT